MKRDALEWLPKDDLIALVLAAQIAALVLDRKELAEFCLGDERLSESGGRYEEAIPGQADGRSACRGHDIKRVLVSFW